MMVNRVDLCSVVALESAPVSWVLMCSAAAAAVAMIEHQPAKVLKLLASYSYPVAPLPSSTMTTNNHRFFQMISLVLDPVDNFDTVDMDYSIVSSEGKQTKNNEYFDYALF